MDWKGVDERLIRRGELLLSLEFLESYDRELKSMNRGKAERHRKVSKVYAAGAYDSSKIYRTLESKGVEAVIKPRRNSRVDTSSELRRKMVSLYKHLGDKGWTRLKGRGNDGLWRLLIQHLNEHSESIAWRKP